MTELDPIFSLVNIGLHAMVPLSLAATGEVINERAGTFNIGLEGIMLLSAFVAVAGAEFSGSWIAGIAAGMLAGILVGVIHGLVSTYWRGDQLIAGVGINIFALGFVAYGLIAVWGTPGHHGLPIHITPPRVLTPIGSVSPMIFVAILLAILTHILLHRTVYGLRIKAAGENPEALDVAGAKIEWTRLAASIFGGALAGVAGAYLSTDWLSFTTKDVSAGRGFIALACVVFSGLQPLTALSAALIFGFFDALRTWVVILPGVKDIVPYQFVNMTPYLVTLAVVAGVIGKRRFPKSIGVPYRRE